MTIALSHRVQQIKPSPTLAMTQRASELKAAGKNIISLSVGEPDFDTPQHIKDGAIHALNQGFTKYTAVDGIPSLKQSIIKKFAHDNQLQYEMKQILVSCGAKHSLYNLFAALLNPGDEVIIPAPYWVSYPDMVMINEAKPVVLETTLEQKFKISPAQLEQAITPKTRLVILNSPSNPSGIAYSKAELTALGEILLRHPQIVIVTDDIYEKILWTREPFCNILNACPALYDRTVVVNGVSKSYAMTGWRIGYAAGPASLIAAMKNIQSQSTSNPTSIAQVATQVALEGDQSFINKMAEIFKQRHDLVYNGLNAIPGFECLPSDGTFYSFPRVEKAIEMLGLQNDMELSEVLLTEAEIAVVPGSAFGSEGYLRLSYATSMELLQEALTRIAKVMEKVAV